MTAAIQEPSTKTCTKCKLVKPIHNFSQATRKKTGKTYRNAWCNTCKVQSSSAARIARQKAKAAIKPKPRPTKQTLHIEETIARHGGIGGYLATRVSPSREEIAYLRRYAHRYPPQYEAILRWADHHSYG